MSVIVFLWALWTAPGVDGPARIPPHLGLQVAAASAHHGADATGMAAILIAENRSRRFDPRTVGRYGAGGERGLFQLAPDPWRREVAERCDPRHRAGHHRYDGLGDCLVLEGVPDLFDAAENIEAAVIVALYLRAKQRERGAPWDWLAQYRCEPAAWQGAARASLACQRSVARVRAWEQALRAQQWRAWQWLRRMTGGGVDVSASL